MPADGGHVTGLALHGQVVVAFGGRRRRGAALGWHRRPAPAQRPQVFRFHGLVVPVGGHQLDAVANGVFVAVTGASHVSQPLDLQALSRLQQSGQLSVVHVHLAAVHKLDQITELGELYVFEHDYRVPGRVV